MESNVKEVNELVKKYNARVIVDNDFEHAYSIPFDAFENTTKEDLIELVFVKQAIIDEMRATQ